MTTFGITNADGLYELIAELTYRYDDLSDETMLPMCYVVDEYLDGLRSVASAVGAIVGILARRHHLQAVECFGEWIDLRRKHPYKAIRGMWYLVSINLDKDEARIIFMSRSRNEVKMINESYGNAYEVMFYDEVECENVVAE